jgi:dienelactone hydrolase
VQQELEGNLLIPDGADGIVVFAHGSGSSRHSPRNKFVARHLREAGLATLLFDLLTAEEDAVDKRTREYRFDIGLLAERLVGATDWLLEQPEAAGLNIGYFGSSTGSAAALIGASERTEVIGAVVSRGGRVDMAESALPQVEASTLFIVGGRDPQVLELNRRMLPALQVEKELEIVEGAGHLFEEQGALEEVADLAREWFVRHLTQA